MTRNQTSQVVQPRLWDLLDRMSQQPGKLVRLESLPADVGGEILAILSKGLYTNPLDCIREYVQNAVDAEAKHVTIKITGKQVIIHDDGNGMDLADIVQARSVGLSRKSMTENVGFRGIGIYSGFDLCNRLVIHSKKRGESYAYILVFNFGEMRAQLEAERKTPQNQRTPLNELITAHSGYTLESDESSLQYTTVHLEEISNAHIERLADREKLRTYILRNLPIAFAEDFPHRDTIYRELRQHIPGYNAVTMTLEFDSEPFVEGVFKPTIPNLRVPYTGVISVPGKDKDERIPIAYYWACLHLGRGKIPDQFRDYRGLVYKVKGFTIGDNRKLQDRFKKGNAGLYWWYTGEIYVLDHNVVPNAARDDFETSPATDQLNIEVGKVLGDLEGYASLYQEQARADEKVEAAALALAQIEAKISAESYKSYEVWRELKDLIDELEARKSKSTNKTRAQELVAWAKRLERIVNSQLERNVHAPIEQKADIGKRQPRQSRRASPSIMLQPGGSGSLFEMPFRPEDQDLTDSTDTVTPTHRTLISILESSNREISGDCGRLIELIDESLSDVLIRGSDIYQRLLDDIEGKLAAGALDGGEVPGI